MEQTTKSAIDRRVVEALESTIPHYARSVRAVLNDLDEDDRITLAQLRALQAIAKIGNPGTLNTTLARQIGVAAPSMTAMIDGLVERELVDRSIDPNNRRQVIILLTDSGKERLTALEAAITDRVSTALAVLSLEQKELLLTALNDLERMLGAMPEGQGRTSEG